MSLLRFAGRVLFSAYYVTDGYQLLTKPDQNADQIASTVDRVVPAVQSFLPPETADRVPEDARTWTRLLGLAQIIGGVAYATGIARRPGAVLLAAATLALPRLKSFRPAHACVCSGLGASALPACTADLPARRMRARWHGGPIPGHRRARKLGAMPHGLQLAKAAVQ